MRGEFRPGYPGWRAQNAYAFVEKKGMRITLIAGAVSSAVAITAVFTAAFAQSESNDGSALTRKRYPPEYKACGRVRCASTARSVPCN